MARLPKGKYTQLDAADSDPDLSAFSSAPDDAGPLVPKDSTVWPEDAEYYNDDSDTPSVAEGSGIPRTAVEGSSSNLSAATNTSLHAAEPLLPPDLESQAEPSPLRLSARQRALNVVHYLFPVRQTYERLSNGITTGRLQTNTPGRFVGQGTDGVFRNLAAKPDTELNRAIQEMHPPTYEEAAADATPEYWESTMISPMYEDEVFIKGLPVGNVANFVWNVLVTVAFQLIGFILCYLLHTSHAAKQGTRAGLGITLIMYGYSVIPANFGLSERIPVRYEPDDPNMIDISTSSTIASSHVDTYLLGFLQHKDGLLLAAAKSPYLAYGVIALGILIVAKSMVDFYRVRQAEQLVLAPRARQETHSVTDEVNEGPE